MQSATQYSVFLVNKPGVLSQVIGAIAQAKVNLVALTIVDAQEHGVLRLVADDSMALGQVLRRLNLPTHEARVLAVELPNRAGALASVLGTLAAGHVNIEYAYATAGAPGGKTTAILQVDQHEKAGKLLGDRPRRVVRRTTVKTRAGRVGRSGG